MTLSPSFVGPWIIDWEKDIGWSHPGMTSPGNWLDSLFSDSSPRYGERGMEIESQAASTVFIEPSNSPIISFLAILFLSFVATLL